VTFEVLLKNGIFYFSEKEAGAGAGGGRRGGEKRWRTIFERSSSNVKRTDPPFPAALSVSSSLEILPYNAPYYIFCIFYVNARCIYIYIYIYI